MEHSKTTFNINFMGVRYFFVVGSLLLIAFSLYVWFTSGIEKYSVDFVGGAEVVVHFDKPLNAGQIRDALTEKGITGAVVQSFASAKDLIEQATGTADETADRKEFSIRLKGLGIADDDAAGAGKPDSITMKTGDLIKDALTAIPDNSFELLKQDFVGPIIGDKIRSDGLKAMFIALICILVYVSFRFEWRFALGAIAALVHDVIITTGIFVLSEREISAAVLAALLTIIGYSLNDTIIVFDRIRENLSLEVRKSRKKRKKEADNDDAFSLTRLVNGSINQTMSRTLLTSLTTLFVVSTLWILGGGAVADLAYALVIGVVVGTYSSVFVACSTILALANDVEDIAVAEPDAQAKAAA